MKIRAVVVLVLLSFVAAPHEGTKPEEVSVRRSPTPPWIEVYHDGVLTSEWQPSDGAVYQSLLLLLHDDFYHPQRPPARGEPRTLLAAKHPSLF